jgi:thiamine biosynthesis lipoprotein
MGTLVTIRVVRATSAAEKMVDKAFEWFENVEDCCSRFDEESELREVSAKVGVAVPASPLLFEAVRFALLVAEESNGAFDPTLGHVMENLGFDREHRTGTQTRSQVPPNSRVSFRDVELDENKSTIRLKRPLTLDLSGVAKGFAIDLAVRVLQPLRDFCIDAGGDLYLAGRNPQNQPWSVGIRHPRADGQIIDTIRVSNLAVCTSGDYEREGNDGAHHLLDPRTGQPATASISATVVAPGAMLADALATTTFVLGPDKGLAFLEAMEVEGMVITPDLQMHETRGYRRGN